VLTGGVGSDEVARFYRESFTGRWPDDSFIGRWPEDTEIVPVSRTVDENRLVGELVLRFTQGVEMPALLPDAPPTDRRVELAFVVVMGFRDGKVTHEHIYWDQASLLVHVGLLDPETLPLVGAEQARKVSMRRCRRIG
jgi:carboxymethylenebutenolidase